MSQKPMIRKSTVKLEMRRKMGDPAKIHSIFLTFKVLIWKKNLNYRERERHVLSQPPPSSSGEEGGSPPCLRHRLLLCALHPACCLLGFWVLRLLPKGSGMFFTMECKALSSEARAPPLPAISHSAANFPFIKLSLISLSSFSCFPQQNWVQSWACLSLSFSFLSFHN